MEIRHPETEEVDAVADLWVALAESQHEYGSHIRAGTNRSQIRESLVRHAVGDRLLVACDPGVVGFVMFTLEEGSYEQDVTRGVLENLYVVPDRRNEGIGSALLETAERRLRERGVDVIALEVMADNAAARRFYRDRGYREHRLELEKETDTHSKDRP